MILTIAIDIVCNPKDGVENSYSVKQSEKIDIAHLISHETSVVPMSFAAYSICFNWYVN